MSDAPATAEKSSPVVPSALDENTFLTALNGSSTDISKEAYTPAGLDRVEDLHGKVTHIVHNLSDKLGLVLKKQEKDFLAAYRAHMYNVQKELQNLRSKVDEAELAMKKDAKIVGLQKERNWFRKEALRLDSFSTNIKKDLKFMREKLLTIEEDRNWLEKQLKASKKQNKLLRAELEIRLSSTPVHTPLDDPRAMSPMFPPTRGGGRQQSGRSATMTPSMGMGRATKAGKTMHHSSSQQPKASEKMVLEMKDLKEETRMLKKQLKQAQNELIKLHSNAVEEQRERSALEELFLRCVDTVKRDVERRKAEPSTGFKGTRLKRDSYGGLSQGPMSQPVKLSQFTAPDRRRVIEELLGQDEVLAYLYDALFPPTVEELGGMEDSDGQYGDGYENYGDEGKGVFRIPTSTTTSGDQDRQRGNERPGKLNLDPQVEQYLRETKKNIVSQTM